MFIIQSQTNGDASSSMGRLGLDNDAGLDVKMPSYSRYLMEKGFIQVH
jgi:hypothetical protein